ncbi:MAG TPA: DUF2249 domain-containing protein [Polyangia bacterium]
MSRRERELDVRQYAPRRRLQTIFEVFDQLAAGEVLRLSDSHDPKLLLFRLERARPRTFDWAVLQAGPAVHRIAIRRRAGHGPRDVMEYLNWEHHRLDALVQATLTSAGRGQLPEARTRFAEFACGITRHMEMEERLLLPRLHRLGPAPRELGRVLAEHGDVRRLTGAISRALGAELAFFLDALRELEEMLLLHDMREERLLYPLIERAARGGERDALVLRMQAV